jgi:signal peptidase I
MGTETTYHRRRIRRFALVGAGATAGAAALAIGRLRPFRAVVRGSSMEPTLREGDVLLAFARVTPRTGDVVVIERPERVGFEMVKRVIGSPGEVVHLLPDGSRLPEPVPLREGEWFVVGDAPGGSTDSRAFGPVRKSNIRGVVRMVVGPRERAGLIKPRR